MVNNSPYLGFFFVILQNWNSSVFSNQANDLFTGVFWPLKICLNQFSVNQLLKIGICVLQTLDIVAENPDKFRVVALAAGSNVAVLADQVYSLL